MGLLEWLRAFKALHDRAKKGALTGAELATYHAGRDELARALLAAQRVSLQKGMKPRRALRVARALQADLELHDGNVRGLTLELSTGGFSLLMERPPKVGDELTVALRIPGGEPLRSRARVCEVRPGDGNARVGFELLALDAADAERLELFVFDVLLTQLQG